MAITAEPDTGWSDVGPSLTGVVAEALCAYAVWRALPEDATVDWTSGHGHDVEVRQDGRVLRVDAKLAWTRGAPSGFIYCSPLKLKDQKKYPLDFFALVVLEREAVKVQYDGPKPGMVRLAAEASSETIYFLPAPMVPRLLERGALLPEYKGRWRISLDCLTLDTHQRLTLTGLASAGLPRWCAAASAQSVWVCARLAIRARR